MRVVVALGGNALLRRGEPLTAEVQRRNVATAAAAVARVITAGHQVVVTHGNGPQVGLLALQSAAHGGSDPYPLDVLGAETEGMIGYMIVQELQNRLPGRDVAGLLTQIEVDPLDPAFRAPTKPIGPVYSRAEARRLAQTLGWVTGADGDGFRRLVASPAPRRILEIATIRLLVEAGVVVICVGGGGIPVAPSASGAMVGIEAVIDKDHASALLACEIEAEVLLLLTDVDGVYRGWETPRAVLIEEATPSELEALSFAPGSMAPKVEAACRFVRTRGGLAGIGALEDALEIIGSRKGTRVVRQKGLPT